MQRVTLDVSSASALHILHAESALSSGISDLRVIQMWSSMPHRMSGSNVFSTQISWIIYNIWPFIFEKFNVIGFCELGFKNVWCALIVERFENTQNFKAFKDYRINFRFLRFALQNLKDSEFQISVFLMTFAILSHFCRYFADLFNPRMIELENDKSRHAEYQLNPYQLKFNTWVMPALNCTFRYNFLHHICTYKLFRHAFVKNLIYIGPVIPISW